jgi:hypothetical protein
MATPVDGPIGLDVLQSAEAHRAAQDQKALGAAVPVQGTRVHRGVCNNDKRLPR